MDYLNTAVGRLTSAASFLRSNGHSIATCLTLMFFWFMVLSVYDGSVQAQAVPSHIDNPASWDQVGDNSFIGMNDDGQNIQTLKEGQEMAWGLNTATKLIGPEVHGEAAVQRAEELGITGPQRYGLLGTVDSEVVAMVTTPPGVDIPSHLANQFVPGYSTDSVAVYAQGEGDGFIFLRDSIGLEPLWEMFRNLAYAGYVLIIMVSGFMIMFRSKLGGQTTVNIVNTLPGIVVGLVLVTFSFAIVGFVIDIGRLLTLVIGEYLESALGGGGFQVSALSGPLQMFWHAFSASVHSISPGQLIQDGILSGGNFMLLLFPPAMALAGIIWILLIIVMAAIALYAAIRVYITLITAYIKIFIDLILGPVYILFGSLPGKSMMITDWLKRLFASVLVFPVVFFMLNLGRWIGYSQVNTGVSGAIEFMSGGQASTPLIQVRGIFVIAIYLFAASAPSIIQDILAVTESKGTAKAMDNTKKAAGKIPIIGGAFG